MTDGIKTGLNTFGTPLHISITCPAALPLNLPGIQKAGLDLRVHRILPVPANTLTQFLQSAPSHFPN